MFIKIIIGIIGVIIIIEIIEYIIKKIRKYKKEINFNEFDDLEKIKQEQNDEQHMKNELKELQKLMEENELQKIKNRKKQKNIIDIIDKGIKDRKKRKKTRILEEFEPDLEQYKIYEGSEIVELNEDNEKFNLDLFKKWCSGIFLCIEMGHQKELETIKTSIISSMYNILIKNINEFAQDGLKLERDEIFIEDIKLLDYGKYTDREEIKILIKSQMKEYIMNVKNKRVIRGSKRKVKQKNVIMTFRRKREELEKEGFLSNCPNCGAAISQIEFGKCQYCESIILPIRYNWVLVKFEMV